MKRIITKVATVAILCSLLSSCVCLEGRRGCRSRCDISPAVYAVGALIHILAHRCH